MPSYAVDYTIYDFTESIDNAVMSLQESTIRIFQWLLDNEIKGSTDKFHLIMRTDEELEILILQLKRVVMKNY